MSDSMLNSPPEETRSENGALPATTGKIAFSGECLPTAAAAKNCVSAR